MGDPHTANKRWRHPDTAADPTPSIGFLLRKGSGGSDGGGKKPHTELRESAKFHSDSNWPPSRSRSAKEKLCGKDVPHGARRLVPRALELWKCLVGSHDTKNRPRHAVCHRLPPRQVALRREDILRVFRRTRERHKATAACQRRRSHIKI